MARYGALIAWAQAGGHKEVIDLLQQTLDEEKKADKLLNDLGVKHINNSAAAVEKPGRPLKKSDADATSGRQESRSAS
jgi:ferritin-like metal-binding protein YciE